MKSWLESFAAESRENRALVAKERLALEVAVALGAALERSGLSKADFARALGVSKGYVTRLLQGSYNLSLGTIIDLASHLDLDANIDLAPRKNATKQPR